MHPLDLAPFLPRLAWSLLAGALTWWASLALGELLLRRAAPALPEELRWPLAAAAGYAGLGGAVALLALAHLAYAPAVIGIPIAVLAVARDAALRAVPRALTDAVTWVRSAPAADMFLLACAAAAVATSVIAAALPAVWWDPIAYHLPIAASALRAHTLAYDPAMTQTAFPLLAECAGLPAYAIAGASGAAMATLGAGIALAWLCGAIALRFAPAAHTLTVALVACCPLLLWLAPSFYVDVPYALFAVGALALPLAAGGMDARGAAWVCGALAGAAAAVKYPGVLLAAIALAALCLSRRRDAGKITATFAIAFAAVAGGWYVRAAILTGDPAYPFLTALAPAQSAVRDFAQRYVTMTAQWCGGPATPLDLVLVPWRMLVDPRRYCGDPGYALQVGAVFFVAGLVAWRATWKPGALTAVLACAWFAGSRQDRFLIPALCLYAITVAVAVWSLPVRDGLKRTASIALGALSALAVIAAWLPSMVSASANSVVPDLSFIAGRESASDLLDARLESYASMEWLRTKIAPGEKVLALDDVRDYYLDGAAVWANPYYQPVVRVDWGARPQDRYAPFSRAGFRYAIANLNPAYVSRTPTGLDSTLGDDVRSGLLREVFAANGVIVIRLPTVAR